MRRFSIVILFLVILCHVTSGIIPPPQVSFRQCERYKGGKENPVNITGDPFIILVTDQNDLNGLNSNIRKAIKEHRKNIEVRFSSGPFYYNKLPVYLYNIDSKDVSISLKGDNTILIAGGEDFRGDLKTASFDKKNMYLNDKNEQVDIYSDVHYALSQPEILDLKTKECRMRIDDNRNYKGDTKIQIQLSEWFHSPIYNVSKIQGGFVYFIADDLSYNQSRGCYNINYDEKLADILPRYRLISSKSLNDYRGKLHECSVSEFLTLYRVNLKSFSLSGFSFIGCAKGNRALMYFREVKAESISISNCGFEYLNQLAVKVKQVDNFVFKDNVVKNCFWGAVYSDIDCSNTVVKNNHFYRTALAWSNSSCVSCYGSDFLVANNVFEDIGYASVYTGYHHNWGKEIVSSGVIENNEVFFGEEYYSQYDKHTLVDGGAFYMGTLCKKVIIRYNFIHHFKGVHSTRAIYCDEGAMNIKIYGNVIHGIDNSFSVLSWRARSINKQIPQSNDGIDFFNNVIWGKYKFDEREKSSCIHGKNLILYSEGESIPSNQLINFAYQEEDLYCCGAQLINNRVVLPNNAQKEVKRFLTYSGLKRWLE